MDKTYIGEQEIKGIEKNVVTFADDTTKEYTEKQLTYLVTEEPKDLSAVRDLMITNILPDMIKVLADHNVRKGDLDAVLQHVAGLHHVAIQKAIGKSMGTYEEGRHIEYCMEDIDMSLIGADNFIL